MLTGILKHGLKQLFNTIVYPLSIEISILDFAVIQTLFYLQKRNVIQTAVDE